MENIPLKTVDVREILKDRVVLFVGDSIVRGIFKDLACLLTGNDRLLYDQELKFNRHENKQGLFGEVIDLFTVDRKNSIFNQEKRVLRSTEDHYSITFVFCSRVWNKTMSQLIANIDAYDIVFMCSQIWDLTRYRDEHGEIYLKNIDLLFDKLKLSGKHVIWIVTPPVDNRQYTKLDQLMSNINSLVISKAVDRDFSVLNLNKDLQNYLHLRSNDGLHWSPEGHRIITRLLINCIGKIPKNNIPNENDSMHYVSFFY